MQHPDHLRLNRRQHDDWLWLWKHEPWGDRRQDLRQAVHFLRWGSVFNNSDQKGPNLIWPYFDESEELTPEEMLERAKNFDDAIEPKPGGGYRYKPGREPKLDGNDNR